MAHATQPLNPTNMNIQATFNPLSKLFTDLEPKPMLSKQRTRPQVCINEIANQLTADLGIGMWLILPESGKVTICPVARELFGQAMEGLYTVNGLIRSLLSEDARKLVRGLKEACRNKGHIQMDLRLKTLLRGEVNWLRVTGKFVDAAESGNEVQIRGTVVDITEEKNLQLKREDYVHLLNHELKSPLTTMILYIQAAKKRVHLQELNDTVEMLTKAEHQVGSMTRMIDNFLGDSMLSNSRMPILPQRFDMLQLLQEVALEMENQYPARHFELGFSSAAVVCADRDKIAQVLVNYLGNAVKYSSGDSPILINCSCKADELQVSVTDSGAGISEQDQEKVFDRFYRTHTTGAKGFGLGLYLVKEIISSHGGQVWVNSTLGKGSIFHFSLPQ
jgi:two-component system sensor histidine kinase VicK